MAANTHLAQKNAALLEQALELLRCLPEGVFEARPRHFERGGVGAHLRHVLDHYDAFLDGLEQGRIDYDERERDPRTESEIGVARERLDATLSRLRRALADLPPQAGARAIEVAMDLGGPATAAACTSGSSLGRELQYLLAHTVHHFALMAVA